MEENKKDSLDEEAIVEDELNNGETESVEAEIVEKETVEEEKIQEEKIQEEVLKDNEKIETEKLLKEEFEGINMFNKKLKSENQKIKDENIKFQNEIDALKDRLLRMSAEYDNFRKRTVKEKEGIYTDACEDIMKNIFPVLDNLERAANCEGTLEDVKKGVEMTVKQFNDSLKKIGVEEITTNIEFDPNLHHAVMHVEDKDYGNNQIVEVFEKGYKKGEKVLRYSMVKVAN